MASVIITKGGHIVSEITNEQEHLLAILKDWITELDASYLAKEDLIVYWGKTPDSDIESDWQFLKLSQAARIIKTTRVPFHLMRKCTPELLLLAFQEEEKVFTQGINGHTSRPSCFSFERRKPQWECPYKTVIVRIFSELKKMRKNIRMLDLRKVVVRCMEQLGEEMPGLITFNRQINAVVEQHTEFEVRMYANRFMVKGESITGYKHPEIYAILELTSEIEEQLVRSALENQ